MGMNLERVLHVIRWLLALSVSILIARVLAGPATGSSNYPSHSSDFVYLFTWISLAIWGIAEAVSILTHPKAEFGKILAPTARQSESYRSAERLQKGLCATALLLGLIVYRSLFEQYTMTYGDSPSLGPTHYLATAFPFPSNWVFGQFGSFSVTNIRTIFPVTLSSLFAKIGVNFAISQRLIYTLPFLVAAAWGTRSLARRLGTDSFVTTAAVLLLVVNYSVVDWYAGGWQTTLIALSLAPSVVLLELKWIDSPRVLTAFVIGLLYGIIILCDVRSFIVLVILNIPLLLGLMAIPDSRRGLFHQVPLKRVSHLLVALVALFLTILPQLTAIYMNSARHLGGALLPSSYYNVSNLSQFSYYSLADTMSLFNPWWPYFDFFNTSRLQTVPALNIWPILLVVGVIFTPSKSDRARRIRLLGLWAYLLGSAFASGVDSPFGPLNRFLWNTVPGFNLFRNPELWTQLPLLGVLLIALALVPPISDIDAIQSSPPLTKQGFPVPGTQWVRLLLVAGVLLQGALIAVESIQHPVNNLSAHTSVYASRVERFLDNRQGSVLWIPTSPAIAYQHLVSSAQLDGVPLNSWLGTAPFPNLKSNDVASGGPLYPELFSSDSTAWSFINQFRIGYLVVDRLNSPWGSIGMANLHTGVESTLRHLGLALVAQNSQYAVFRGTANPIIDAGKVLKSQAVIQHPLQTSSFPPNSFHLLPSLSSGRSQSYDNAPTPSSRSCARYFGNCETLTSMNSVTEVQSGTEKFDLHPGDRVSISPGLDMSHARGASLQVILICQGISVANETVSSTGPTTHLVSQFEYSDVAPLSQCSVRLVATSQSSPKNTITIGVGGVRINTIPPLAPRTSSLSSDILSTGMVQHLGSISYQTVDDGQDSWKVTLSSSTQPRMVNFWQSFSPGWNLWCPSPVGNVSPSLTNGWAMSFEIPAGTKVTCELSFPVQSTINNVVIISLAGLLILLALSAILSRRRSRIM